MTDILLYLIRIPHTLLWIHQRNSSRISSFSYKLSYLTLSTFFFAICQTRCLLHPIEIFCNEILKKISKRKLINKYIHFVDFILSYKIHKSCGNTYLLSNIKTTTNKV